MKILHLSLLIVFSLGIAPLYAMDYLEEMGLTPLKQSLVYKQSKGKVPLDIWQILSKRLVIFGQHLPNTYAKVVSGSNETLAWKSESKFSKSYLILSSKDNTTYITVVGANAGYTFYIPTPTSDLARCFNRGPFVEKVTGFDSIDYTMSFPNIAFTIVASNLLVKGKSIDEAAVDAKGILYFGTSPRDRVTLEASVEKKGHLLSIAGERDAMDKEYIEVEGEEAESIETVYLNVLSQLRPLEMRGIQWLTK